MNASYCWREICDFGRRKPNWLPPRWAIAQRRRGIDYMGLRYSAIYGERQHGRALMGQEDCQHLRMHVHMQRGAGADRWRCWITSTRATRQGYNREKARILLGWEPQVSRKRVLVGVALHGSGARCLAAPNHKS